MLELDRLGCGYRGRSVLRDISFELVAGELLCLLGPNGVGKTTLFKTILGLLPAQGGSIRLAGEPIVRWSRRRFARHVGYVPQAHTPPFPFRVRDVVAMGRCAHLGSFAAPGAHDRALAEAALDSLGIAGLAGADYTRISGGERQLVLIARALAQQPHILVMDEPTANLDYGNQLKVMAHVRDIAARGGMGVILTTHHPDHALLYGSRALVLDRAKRYAVGTPAEVITEAYLQDTYGVSTEIHDITRRNGLQSRLCVPAWGAPATAGRRA
ncbi:ABC transporter ATP-binding protein [Parasulfuritortus cantonensis]|uniref:ABC transporter ATP-binding protein n=1 Tax=Parasulfuritortus cantonensis TaxID=2528202 RepID=A0A4V2NWU2_9PROT|nr:ABC transporter ATP-binding protein [Parasulfuritortus cantonensis]TCJ18702.1 ABC transporter ATP-binding protein [Parasulfuritortus cantonensis]